MNTKLPKIATLHSIKIFVEKDKVYHWCSCGMSDAQPFCNEACKESDFKPVEYTADADKIIGFCGCKHTKIPPFCDGQHKQLNKVVE